MKNFIVWCLLAAFFLVCNVDAKSKTWRKSPKSTSEKKVSVTLQVFSGRKNPSWNLTKLQVDKLLVLIKNLPKTEPSELMNGLGYSGFQIAFERNSAAANDEITAFKGQIIYKTENAKQYSADKDRKVEMFLLNTGKRHLNSELTKRIEREIKSPAKPLMKHPPMKKAQILLKQFLHRRKKALA